MNYSDFGARSNRRALWLWAAWIAFGVTLALLYMGGFTTTIKAGMVFLDWPLSNGSLNPEGWTSNLAMMAEHSHRLLGKTVGFLTIVLLALVLWQEPSPLIRKLAWASLGLVILQGVLGGLRVLFNSLEFAIIHGCLAQVFLALLLTVALLGTRAARRLDREPVRLPRHLTVAGFLLFGVVFVQLIVAAVMRHQDAGLAIPTFPLMPDGSLLPSMWSFPVTIHFVHRVLALVLFVATLWWVGAIVRYPRTAGAPRLLAYILVALLFVQVTLGAMTIWTGRDHTVTTFHVLFGALFFCTMWGTALMVALPRGFLRITPARAAAAEKASRPEPVPLTLADSSSSPS